MNVHVLRLLLRPTRGNAATLVIPATAFAIVTALVLTVVGGAQTFWAVNDDSALTYQTLAAIALVLLVIPLASLGGAAARLSARRRDERLSTLRLLGATPTGVGVATIIESTLIAAAGVVVGIAGYLALVPLIGLIPFRGQPLGAAALLLSPLTVLWICLAAILLAAVSAVIGLRRVVISPLGVRMRSTPPSVHWIRAVIVAVALVIAFMVANMVPQLLGVVSITVILAGLFGGVLALLNVVGPWALRLSAKRQARVAQTPQRLLAARSVLESPKGAWRQVGGIAMASFMAVFAGTGVSLMNTVGAADAPPEAAYLVTDMRTGLIITLVASFLMVAAQVGVTQASEILDQRDLHRSLHSLGAQMKTVDGARRRAIMSPLLFVALGSALCAAIIIFPILGMTLVFAPLSLLTIAAVLAGGILLVWVSTLTTRPLLARSFAAA